MTRDRMSEVLSKYYGQLEQLKKKISEVEEQKQMAEDAESMKIIHKLKISPEQLRLLNDLSEQEIHQFLEQRKHLGQEAETEGQEMEIIRQMPEKTEKERLQDEYAKQETNPIL